MLNLPPRLVIAAPASGAGKTTVASGLMVALSARGLRVAGAKVGPDYIDPGYHALATGRPGRNLDPFLVGEHRIAPLAAHGAAGADLLVIEGVMGLFDGVLGTEGFASTAHVARLLDAPVLLVVDVRGMGASVAALVSGFARHDRRVRVAGVVLNRVGSERHSAQLRAALAGIGVPVLGEVPRASGLATPERHLGLVPVAERPAQARSGLDELRAVISDRVDLAAVVAVARSAPALAVSPWSAAVEVLDGAGALSAPRLAASASRRVRVALASGPAFTFGYAEHAELLAAAGAEVVGVDPLHDEALPPGTGAFVVGGGFPEVYAAELAANARFRAAVAAHAAAGRPVLAECAGLAFLCSELDGHPMCGVLPARAKMTARLHLGYRTAIAATSSPLGAAGRPVHAHEFHYGEVTPGAGSARAGAAPAWTLEAPPRHEGFVASGVHASYLHVHWAGGPQVAPRLLAAARDGAPTGESTGARR